MCCSLVLLLVICGVSHGSFEAEIDIERAVSRNTDFACRPAAVSGRYGGRQTELCPTALKAGVTVLTDSLSTWPLMIVGRTYGRYHDRYRFFIRTSDMVWFIHQVWRTMQVVTMMMRSDGMILLMPILMSGIGEMVAKLTWALLLRLTLLETTRPTSIPQPPWIGNEVDSSRMQKNESDCGRRHLMLGGTLGTVYCSWHVHLPQAVDSCLICHLERPEYVSCRFGGSRAELHSVRCAGRSARRGRLIG